MYGRYREIMAKLVTVQWVDLGKMKIQNWSIIAMIKTHRREVLRRPKLTRNCSAYIRQCYCRTKKKNYTQAKSFLHFIPCNIYISPEIIKTKNYSNIRQQFYMLHCS
jgi:hypothetical protein